MPQTLTARRTNLARAQEVRLAAAAIRRKVASGELTVSAAIAEPAAQSLRVDLLLRSQPHIGERKADQIMTALYLHPRKRLRELTDHQKQLLAAAAALPVTRSNQLRLSSAMLNGELVIA